MSVATALTTSKSPSVPSWVWVHVIVAALAMVATLPGRTQGLGLFTEPILQSTRIDRGTFATINLWATLIGGLFCLPAGWLLDRFGPRMVLLVVTSMLGITVWWMSAVPILTITSLTVFILLTRGLGQSALSVVSLSLIGQSAGYRTGLKMGIYSCLMSMGFIVAFAVLRSVIQAQPDDWRTPWGGIGIGVGICGLIGALLIRPATIRADAVSTDPFTTSRTLGTALRSGTFWVFALGTSFYGLVAAGTSLFNESILAERGFDKTVFLNVTIIGIPVGLVANLAGGWWATRVALNRLFAGSFALFALALCAFPFVTTLWHIYAYAIVIAGTGGVITVCFFTVWRRGFGPAHLGRIQGVAQWLTVLFSAVGPLLFASCQSRFGGYTPLFPYLAAVAFLLALFAWRIPISQPIAESITP